MIKGIIKLWNSVPISFRGRSIGIDGSPVAHNLADIKIYGVDGSEFDTIRKEFPECYWKYNKTEGINIAACVTMFREDR